MTIANFNPSAVPSQCQEQSKRMPLIKQGSDKTGSRLDLTYSTCSDDAFEDSARFFYFSTERPPVLPPPSLEESKTIKEKTKYTRRQWFIIIDFILANICGACCVSLQAPFYPAEAERKGVSPSEYGFVFGVFELVVFIISPIYGRHIDKLGHNFLVGAGTFLTASCCILFGLLEKVQDANAFLVLSFLVRIVEAIGEAGFLTGSYTIIALEFPKAVSSMFGTMEAAYGIGLFIGPTIGGILFEVGGYSLPFILTGSLLLIATVVTIFILPEQAEKNSSTKQISMFRLFQVPSVAIAGLFTFCASISIGFLVAVLEPHLRQFQFSPSLMGVMFVISGGVYALTTPIWGKLCESVLSPCFVCGCGGVLLIFAYLLIGPSPIFHSETTLIVCIVGLIFHGFGLSGELVGSFSLAHKGAVSNGFPDNIETYGLVSGYWTSLFAFGAFVGPSIGGLLLDAIGFGWGSQIILILHIIAVIITFVWCFLQRKQSWIYIPLDERGTLEEKQPLV